MHVIYRQAETGKRREWTTAILRILLIPNLRITLILV